MQAPPTTPEEQLRWLVDRAAIADLVIALARGADTRAYQEMAGLFTEDCTITIDYDRVPTAAGATTKHFRAADIATSIAAGRFAATHHMLGNIEVEVDDDSASSHHYVLAAHVPKADAPEQHADIGGWYDNEYRRTADGWRISALRLTFVYAGGLRF